MRYVIPGASALDFPKCIPQRLRQFGEWSVQDSGSGAILNALNWPAKNYAVDSRKTPEGWLYFPAVSEETPSIEALLRPQLLRETCNPVSLVAGPAILIRPAYLEPCRIYSNGDIGDPVTEHGARARRVMDILRDPVANPQGLTHPEALQLWLEAVGKTYRATPEVIDDLGIFTLEDVDQVIAAVFAGPKPLPGVGTSPLPSPG